ncbi:hypothetical protein LEP1GSC192_2161 [Leptospira sp. B5-022]|nr:hypothetical protein LEP1GSC192_2161 [Leptospira sp. B5-022]
MHFISEKQNYDFCKRVKKMQEGLPSCYDTFKERIFLPTPFRF